VADEIPESRSFADIYEESAKHDAALRRQPRIGEKVSGKIFQLGPDTAFVSLGGRSEALIELRELKDDEGILRYGVGDTIEAHVIEAGAKGVILSRALAKGSANLARLAEARATGMPVEGLVLAVNKGGLEIAVGDVRAFCPISQVDLRFVEKPDRFVGEKLMFKVTEVRDRNVVLSRRAILEEEQKAKAAETRKSLAEGKVVRGQVISLRDFGAFVDLGGIEGLIPTSELSHSRIGHPSEVVKVGDELEVEVLRIEPSNPNSPDKAKHKERITLSLRARQEDPWKSALAELNEGTRVTGKVVRLQPFGAFVELRPGVDGLIHVSALSDRRIAHPKDVVSVGQEVQVEVEKIDATEKRIGLRLVRPDDQVRAEKEAVKPSPPAEPVAKPKVGQTVTGTVDRIEPYGVFLKFPGGRGLIPASETGTDRGSDLKRHFQLGQELKASILEIDASGKIRLSITAATKAEERAEAEAWVQKQSGQVKGKGFGTFADLLRGKKII
jgi:small subunit ribosomal protein S1